MVSYCPSCFSEIRPEDRTCRRCGRAEGIRPREYIARLRAALAGPHVETQRRAILIIGDRRVSEAIPDLCWIARHGPNPYLAEEAAIALGKIGGQIALDALLLAARRNRSAIVRARAIESLLATEGKWAQQAYEVARRDPSAIVRAAALAAREFAT
jgi:HEAT repeat protein